jgi:hypothetical protein
MAKKAKSRLAGDIRASLDELRDFVAGRKTGAIVHRVTPRETDARAGRIKLEPKAARRALAKTHQSAGR